MREPADHLEHGGPEPAVPRGRPALWRAGSALAVAGAIAVLVTSAPTILAGPPTGSPPPAATTAPSPSRARGAAPDTMSELQAMSDRSRAQQSRLALIEAVPPAYRRAAERASALGHGRTPAAFFLALAFNRTLYGALLRGDTGRSFASRGPVQWQPADFRRFAAPGHADPAVPLDAFLAVDAALNRAGPPDFSQGAYSAALTLGATPEHARADDETFAVLSAARERQ